MFRVTFKMKLHKHELTAVYVFSMKTKLFSQHFFEITVMLVEYVHRMVAIDDGTVRRN